MRQFIDLMADHEWFDRDIVNFCEDWVWSQFPRVKYDILLNKLEGTRMPPPLTYVMTEGEQMDLMYYGQLRYEAGAMADQARVDMALLLKAKAVEVAQVRLAQPVVVPDVEAGVTVNADAVQLDTDERVAAQAVLNAADADTNSLVTLRNRNPV